MVRASALAFFALLAACAETEEDRKWQAEYDARIAARIAVADRLRDPDSAEFSELQVYSWQDSNPVVCGKVNAANGFGGMVGSQRFVSDGKHMTVLEEAAASGELFQAAWDAHCNNN